MNWLYYLLEANLYLGIFYLAYCLFFNKETYYTLNRVYLLLICIISFVIPLLQIGKLKPVEPAEPVMVMQAIATPVQQGIPVNNVQTVVPVQHFDLHEALLYTYLLGVAVMAFLLVFKLYKLSKLTRAEKNRHEAKYKLIYLNDSNTAFSFFNYLFIGTAAHGSETIIKHELVHIRQKHSVDIILLELLKAINWFNPFIYLVQRSLKTIHEYIADEKTAATESDALNYSTFLLNNAYGLSGSSITHSFFNYNLLKKRIIMLNQKRSGSLARLKYLLAVPLCAGMLCASTLAFSKNYGIDLLPQSKKNIIPPPPAPPLSANHKIPSPPVPHKSATSLTSKNFRVEELQFLYKNKVDFGVNIYLPDGSAPHYFKSQATAATIKMLSEKYAYTFPGNGKYKLAHSAHMTIPESGVTLVIPRKIPADPKDVSPASPLTVKLVNNNKVKFPPPVIKPDKPKASVTPPPAVNAPSVASQNKMKPPPPPPFDPVYKDFFDYLQNTMNHTGDTRKEHLTGTVVAQYTLDANRHISNVQIISGDKRIGTFASMAIHGYKGSIDQPAGDYKVGFDFTLGNHVDPDKIRAGDAKMMAMPGFAGIISVTVHPAG